MHGTDTIRGAAHDIRHLLSTIRLSAELLETTGNPDIARRAQRILRAVDRGARICSDFVEEQRPVAQATVEVRDVMEEVVAHLPVCSGVDVAVCAPEHLRVAGDCTSLFRVLFNLASNALDAVVTSGGRLVRLSAAASPDRVTFRVEDDGPGFGAVVSDARARPGQPASSGLGLKIARKLSKEMGGELRILRTGPNGTVFGVSLPRAPAPHPTHH